MAKGDKLSAKQILFVSEYLIDLNATQAAIRAGYSKKTAQRIGSENLSKPLIHLEIVRKLKKTTDKLDISAEYVLSSLKNVAERCQQTEPILDNKGKPTGEYKFDSSGANKSLELIGKHLKLFTEVHEIKDLKPMKVEVTYK